MKHYWKYQDFCEGDYTHKFSKVTCIDCLKRRVQEYRHKEGYSNYVDRLYDRINRQAVKV